MSHSREQDLSTSDESAQQRAQHTRGTLDLLRCTAHPNECDICAEVLCAIASNVGAWIPDIMLIGLCAWYFNSCNCPTWDGETVHVCDVIITGEA